MYAFRLRAAAVALVAGIGLSGCMTPYGNGLSVGLGNGGYYDPYYGGYGYGSGYPGYGYGYAAGYPGYGYGMAPYGWYGNYYYPGSGYYVYDMYRNPYFWTDDQRDYWEARRDNAMTSKEFRALMESQKQNWDGFAAGPTAATQQVRTQDGRRVRVERNRPVRTERATIVTQPTSPLDITTDYKEESPAPAPSDRVRVALVAGSGTVATDDLYRLLRRRLLILSLIVAGGFLAGFVLDFVAAALAIAPR